MFNEEIEWKKFKELDKYLDNLSLDIERNEQTMMSLTQKMDEAYKTLSAAAHFFYDGKSMKEDWYSLIYDLEQIEVNLPRFFYIMPSAPSFYYKEKRSTTPLSKKEADILDWIVFEARSRAIEIYRLKNPHFNLELTNYCGKMSELVEDACKKIGVEAHRIKICPGFDEEASLLGGSGYHYATIICLNNTPYLVDCSYRQFFSLFSNSLQRIAVPSVTNSKVGSYMLLTKKRQETASVLLKRGWIPLDANQAKCYFDGFALSYRNGIYYEQTNDYSFTPPYTLEDYLCFLNKEDSQLNHESREVLELQRRPCKLSKFGLF